MINQSTPFDRASRRRSPAPRPAGAFAAAAAFLLVSPAALAQVRFQALGERIAVEVNGKPFTVLHYGKAQGKPYLHPLMTASGKPVTRGFPDAPLAGDPTDRPHLRGLIVGHEEVKGPGDVVLDFWENDPHPWYRHH